MSDSPTKLNARPGLRSKTLGWMNGLDAVRSPTGSKYGVPAGMHLFMGTVCLLAAAGDIRLLVRGGALGVKRITRHLWRMCFGLFIATGSFFLGQQQVFPAFIRKANVLFVPAILPLILLISGYSEFAAPMHIRESRRHAEAMFTRYGHSFRPRCI